jgi:hypothetical protein
MRSRLPIWLDNQSLRSALSKIQLASLPAESKVSIFNRMGMGHCEILSWWQHKSYGLDNDIG